ncbi:MAG: helix-turn-helix transcriptional regulator [Erysipelotrichales bacterium]|nr:helix-turn-helix transcriptional regulator [Erysipelotrichales bacterium]
MDIIERIFNLMNENNWSTYELSLHSNLTQSTISSMFRRKSDPTLSTLIKICNAFNITLSEFFSDSNIRNNNYVIEQFNKLNPQDKELILYLINKLK